MHNAVAPGGISPSVKIPEPPRGAAEHGVALALPDRRSSVGDTTSIVVSIARRERAHRPVRSNHQPIGAETVERGVHIAAELRRRPARASAPRSRAPTASHRRSGAPPSADDRAATRRTRRSECPACRDDRARTATVGKAAANSIGLGQLTRIDEDVVRQARALERARCRVGTPDRSRKPSGSAWTMWRTPTSFGCVRDASICASTSGACRSTQPTTPAMNGCSSASDSSQRVSSSVCRTCTATQASIPARVHLAAQHRPA